MVWLSVSKPSTPAWLMVNIIPFNFWMIMMTGASSNQLFYKITLLRQFLAFFHQAEGVAAPFPAQEIQVGPPSLRP